MGVPVNFPVTCTVAPAKQADVAVRLLRAYRPHTDMRCWFNAILYFMQTGDLPGTVIKLITCLFQSGSLDVSQFFGCLVRFALALIQGADLVEAFLKLIECITSGAPTPPAPPEPPPGELEPPEYRDVPRCGGTRSDAIRAMPRARWDLKPILQVVIAVVEGVAGLLPADSPIRPILRQVAEMLKKILELL